MTTVKHVLDNKGHGVHFIHPDASVFDALKIMEAYNIGSLLVLNDGELVGIISERDYARKIVLKGRRSRLYRVPISLLRQFISVGVRTRPSSGA